MSIPPAETRYEKLSPTLQKICLAELNEDPNTVNAHLASFRRWLKSMPHLKCPNNDDFLLKFLRLAKFDHRKAQKRLDNFCTVRSSVERGHPEIFEYLDVNDEKIDLYAEIGFGMLIKTSNEECMFLNFFKDWDIKKLPLIDIWRISFMNTEILMQDPALQIAGFTALMDWSQVTIKSLMHFVNPPVIKMGTRAMQDAMPIRQRQFVHYREPKSFSIVMNLFLHFMKEKLRRKIHRIGDDSTKLTELFPDYKLLPKECGGSTGTLAELKEKMKVDLREFYNKHGTRGIYSDIAVDESKRPKETLQFLTEFGDYKGQLTIDE